ncbi:MAG: hypothetical protein BM485_08820 [Desulfobulbaceae bacterium DB1]|nr:MAG: hypothetical protein BM485_08820 [Desulfobulbaceae bacterium DB1]
MSEVVKKKILMQTKKGEKMSIIKKLMGVCLVSVLAMSLAACSEEGSAEKAGKEVDKAFDSAKEKVHDATK